MHKQEDTFTTVKKWGDLLVSWYLITKGKSVHKLMTGFGVCGIGLISYSGIVAVIKVSGVEIELSLTDNDSFYGLILCSFAFILAILDMSFITLGEHWNNNRWLKNVELFSKDIGSITESVNDYTRYFNNHLYLIINKGNSRDEYETHRINFDEKIIKSINAIEHLIPRDFAKLLWKMRKIISCSFQYEKELNISIHEAYGPEIIPVDITNAASKIYSDYVNCYKDISNALFTKKISDDEIKKIMLKHNINEKLNNTRVGKEYELAVQLILLHRYKNQ